GRCAPTAAAKCGRPWGSSGLDHARIVRGHLRAGNQATRKTRHERPGLSSRREPDEPGLEGHSRRATGQLQAAATDAWRAFPAINGACPGRASIMAKLRSADRTGAGMYAVNDEWLLQHDEPVLDPDLPIVDPHHHLWDRDSRYLLDELLDDVN